MRVGGLARPGPRRAAVLLAWLMHGFAGSGAAQEATGRRGAGEDLLNAPGDMLHVWSAPLRAGVSDLPALIFVTEAVVVTSAFDEGIQRWIREHPDELPLRLLEPLQHPAPLSYLGRSLLLQPISALLYAGGHAAGSDALRDAGIGCATTQIANTFARHAIGRMTGRLRPMYGGGSSDFEPLAWSEWDRRSFPNGHGANIMACASFWNHRLDLGAAGPALYAFAVALGAARVTAGAHWASDTVFGLVFGWAVGREVAGRFAEREADRLRPDAGSSGARGAAWPGVSISWRLPVP